ncbi:MAG TPA: hypothetical protein VMQ61_06820 [Thermoanaerobaculia bacterium]|nr:hypothetical protein [Thermoanaerobaculia bacterium]
MKRNSGLVAATLAAALAGGAGQTPAAAAPTPVSDTVRTMNEAAERYVRLVLALGQHDKDYVDAFYGPEEWRKDAEAQKRPLAQIRAESAALAVRVGRLPDGGDEMNHLRRRFLRRQLEALTARADIVSGRKMSFDEESQALYDATAPVNSEDHFRKLRARLEAELPGKGPLIERYDAFRKDFVIPRDKLDAVFQAAIAEARARTKKHMALPDGETFVVEYVHDKTWSGYNWYQGNSKSLIQVNTDLPVYIDRAVDLACHEGYPGHHVYNVLLEKNLVRDRGWIEFEIYPLFSPESLIAEGSANYGIDVAFPGAERLAFEKTALYPLAGLDASRAEAYGRVRTLAEALAYAGNEAARRYLNGEIDAKAAAAWLTEYALMSPPRAEQRVRFIDQYRSYVINYNLGKDLVGRWIEAQGGTADKPEKRWEAFERLLSTPRLPSELAPASAPRH